MGNYFSNSDYNYCLFCEKNTLIKNTVHCNFCDQCHSIHIKKCIKCDLYKNTILLENNYKLKIKQ